MADPMDWPAYLVKWGQNQRYSGQGYNTKNALPCPVCASPGWATYRIVDMVKALRDPIRCTECARVFKMVFVERAITPNQPSEQQSYLVQTGGPPQPDWLVQRGIGRGAIRVEE